MQCEVITIERLNEYGLVIRDYKKLLRHKKILIEKIGSVKGVNYSRIKVQSGNGLKTSPQEHYAMKLEQINSELKEFEEWIKVETEILRVQFNRIIKRDYRKLLILRYIQRWKWSEIVQELFEFEPDYDDETKVGKYRDMVMYWNRAALKQLEQISSQPFVSAYPKQLGLNEKII